MGCIIWVLGESWVLSQSLFWLKETDPHIISRLKLERAVIKTELYILGSSTVNVAGPPKGLEPRTKSWHLLSFSLFLGSYSLVLLLTRHLLHCCISTEHSFCSFDLHTAKLRASQFQAYMVLAYARTDSHSGIPNPDFW